METKSDSGSSGISHRSLRLQEYALARFVNILVMTGGGICGILLLIWYILLTYYHTSRFDPVGILVYPLFYSFCIAIPCCGLWFLIAFAQLSKAQRRWTLPIVFILLYMAFSFMGGWMTWMMFK